MKKGLLLVILISVLYWGYYYLAARPGVAVPEVLEKAPEYIEKADEFVHDANINIIQTSIEIFRQSYGRYPADIEELVTKGLLKKIPDDGGYGWEYDPVSGEIK